LAFAGTLGTISRIEHALAEYQLAEVRPVKGGPVPAYERPENGNNAVEVPPGSYIATVLDLTGLGRVYAEARPRFRLQQFRDYAVTYPVDAAQINDFLGERLEDPNRQETFLKRSCVRYRCTADTLTGKCAQQGRPNGGRFNRFLSEAILGSGRGRLGFRVSNPRGWLSSDTH
jgi:hypothetical protein